MDQNFYQDTKKENNAIMDDLSKKEVTHEAIDSIVRTKNSENSAIIT